MSRFVHRLILAVGVVSLLTLTRSTPADDKVQKGLIGKQAPEIAAGQVNINGKAMKLSEFKGKVVLVDFWAVWCGPCIATIPTLREWQDEYGSKGLVVLGVTELEGRFGSFDKEKGRPVFEKNTPKVKEEEMLKGFAAYHRLNYQIAALSEKDSGAAYQAYGVEGIPTAVLIDRKGIVRMVKVGSSAANKKALKTEIEKLLGEE